jgi:hypothetical protein
MRKNVKFLAVIALAIISIMGFVMPAVASNVTPVRSTHAQLAAVDLTMWSKNHAYTEEAGLPAAFEAWRRKCPG